MAKEGYGISPVSGFPGFTTPHCFIFFPRPCTLGTREICSFLFPISHGILQLLREKVLLNLRKNQSFLTKFLEMLGTSLQMMWGEIEAGWGSFDKISLKVTCSLHL